MVEHQPQPQTYIKKATSYPIIIVIRLGALYDLADIISNPMWTLSKYENLL